MSRRIVAWLCLACLGSVASVPMPQVVEDLPSTVEETAHAESGAVWSVTECVGPLNPRLLELRQAPNPRGVAQKQEEAQTLANIAHCHWKGGETKSAVDNWNDALQVSLDALGALAHDEASAKATDAAPRVHELTELATHVMCCLGQAAEVADDHDAALEFFNRAEQLLQNSEESGPLLAHVLARKADLSKAQGYAKITAQLLEHALELNTQANHTHGIADNLLRLGQLYADEHSPLYDPDRAESMLVTSLKLWSHSSGEEQDGAGSLEADWMAGHSWHADGVRFVQVFSNIGAIYMSRHESATERADPSAPANDSYARIAAEAYERGRNVAALLRPRPDEEFVSILLNLATVYRKLDKTVVCEAGGAEALEGGTECTPVAAVNRTAEALLEEALVILQDLDGPYSSRVGACLVSLASLHSGWGEWESAQHYLDMSHESLGHERCGGCERALASTQLRTVWLHVRKAAADKVDLSVPERVAGAKVAARVMLDYFPMAQEPSPIYIEASRVLREMDVDSDALDKDQDLAETMRELKHMIRIRARQAEL